MDEELLGTIKQFAGTRCPRNYMFCEGQTLSVKDNVALFSVIGTTYGGDGMNTFKLPDLRPRRDTRVYKIQNTAVSRAHETGDPGTIGHLYDDTVLSYPYNDPNVLDWGDNPRQIICIFGIYPSVD
jgi:hypothetical protein